MEQLVQDYEAGVPTTQLTKKYGIGKGTVLKLLRDHDVRVQRQGLSRGRDRRGHRLVYGWLAIGEDWSEVRSCAHRPPESTAGSRVSPYVDGEVGSTSPFALWPALNFASCSGVRLSRARTNLATSGCGISRLRGRRWRALVACPADAARALQAPSRSSPPGPDETD